MTMRKITSIKNAIEYFRKGTKVETRKNRSGKEYKVYIPPHGFNALNLSENMYDTHGRIAGVITQKFHSFQWEDYARIIERKRGVITKLVLYYE